MGWYERTIMPRLIAAGMKNPTMAKYRPSVPAQAGGTVLELGIGSGLNIPHYGPAVQRLIGVEPSSQLRLAASAAARAAPFPVELLATGAESLPLESASVDCVVSTWTLCSIGDLPGALAETRRVLRPGGRLLFLEHGRSPDAGVARWQDRLAPVLRGLAGCNPNLPMDTLIEEAGFRFATIERTYIEGPRVLSWHFMGSAVPR